MLARGSIRTGSQSLFRAPARTLATAPPTEKKVKQPPKETVQKRVEDLRKYNDQVRALRRDLIEKGYPQQGFERLREKKVAEVVQNVVRKYTREEKEARVKAGLERHEAHVAKVREQFIAKERARILRESIRKKKGDIHRESLLAAAQRELAVDLEQTWNKPVKEDLKAIVPVNAPFLGVLPKRHADIAPLFGDEKHKIRQMYGPPTPQAPAENQYLGYDPRIFEYTVERKMMTSSPETWRPRKFRPTNAGFNVSPQASTPEGGAQGGSTPSSSSS